MQFKETKVNLNLVCSKQCGMVLDLTNRVKFYLKRSMLPCFSSWTHKGEMLPFKDFKSMRNHEKGFIRENIVCKFDAMQLYFSDVNHI